jgi:hypothetical protein
VQTARDGREESIKDFRSLTLKRSPQRLFILPLFLFDLLKRVEDGSVGKISAGYVILDSIEDDRPTCVEQNFILIGIELAQREPATCCQPAQGVAQPSWQAGDIIESQDVAVGGGNEQIPVVTR